MGFVFGTRLWPNLMDWGRLAYGLGWNRTIERNGWTKVHSDQIRSSDRCMRGSLLLFFYLLVDVSSRLCLCYDRLEYGSPKTAELSSSSAAATK